MMTLEEWKKYAEKRMAEDRAAAKPMTDYAKWVDEMIERTESKPLPTTEEMKKFFGLK